MRSLLYFGRSEPRTIYLRYQKFKSAGDGLTEASAGNNGRCRKQKRPAQGQVFAWVRLIAARDRIQATATWLRRRRQATSPPNAIKRPGIPAPTTGPGTAAASTVNDRDESSRNRSAKKIVRAFEAPELNETVLIC